jgi:hypothetical protein
MVISVTSYFDFDCLVVRGDNGLGLVVIICIRVKSY